MTARRSAFIMWGLAPVAAAGGVALLLIGASPGLVTLAGVAAFLLLWFGGRAWFERHDELETGGVLSGPDAAARRYSVISVFFAFAFVLSILFAAPIATGTDSRGVQLAASALPAAVFLAWAWAGVRAVLLSDEMMKAAFTRAAAIAGVIMIVFATVWALFAGFTGAPDFPDFLLAPGFAAIMGLAMQAQGVRQP